MLGYADSTIEMKLGMIDLPLVIANPFRSLAFIMEEWTTIHPDGRVVAIGSCPELCQASSPMVGTRGNAVPKNQASGHHPTQSPRSRSSSIATCGTRSRRSFVRARVKLSKRARHRIYCHLFPVGAASGRSMIMSFPMELYASVYLYTCVVAADC
jgi:hypothetical protein